MRISSILSNVSLLVLHAWLFNAYGDLMRCFLCQLHEHITVISFKPHATCEQSFLLHWNVTHQVPTQSTISLIYKQQKDKQEFVIKFSCPHVNFGSQSLNVNYISRYTLQNEGGLNF